MEKQRGGRMFDATSSETRLQFFESERDRFGRLAEEAGALLKDLRRRMGRPAEEDNDSGDE